MDALQGRRERLPAFGLDYSLHNDAVSIGRDDQSAWLVAPVFSAKGEVSYYLPAGSWHNLLTGEVVQGGNWRTETHNYFSLSLWVHSEHGAAGECLHRFVAPTANN